MTPTSDTSFSIIIPCFNEEAAVAKTIDAIKEAIPDDKGYYEILIVNDGSTDRTQQILDESVNRHENLRVITHETNRGYGAALKTGISQARTELIVITDADGTYPVDRIPDLVEICSTNDMVVGARTADDVTYSRFRAIPKYFLRRWMSWIAGSSIPDINSGMRVFRKSVVERFFGILPNGFSFTVTITLAMLTNYRPTVFVPINYKARIGKSKIKPIRDTLRFIVLILRTGTYFAPLRVFLPVIGILAVMAIISLFYDIIVLGNLTDKTVLLFLFSMNTGMFALLADMIDKRSMQ